MPDQAELRRRVRAAMALADINSWDELAKRTKFSRSLLKDLGTERGTAGEKHLRVIAAATGVPYAWFTVPDLALIASDADEPTITERVEALENKETAGRDRIEALERAQAEAATAITSLRVAVASLAADLLRREQELQGLRDRGHPEERRRGTG